MFAGQEDFPSSTVNFFNVGSMLGHIIFSILLMVGTVTYIFEHQESIAAISLTLNERIPNLKLT